MWYIYMHIYICTYLHIHVYTYTYIMFFTSPHRIMTLTCPLPFWSLDPLWAPAAPCTSVHWSPPKSMVRAVFGCLLPLQRLWALRAFFQLQASVVLSVLSGNLRPYSGYIRDSGSPADLKNVRVTLTDFYLGLSIPALSSALEQIKGQVIMQEGTKGKSSLIHVQKIH